MTYEEYLEQYRCVHMRCLLLSPHLIVYIRIRQSLARDQFHASLAANAVASGAGMLQPGPIGGPMMPGPPGGMGGRGFFPGPPMVPMGGPQFQPPGMIPAPLMQHPGGWHGFHDQGHMRGRGGYRGRGRGF